MKNLIFFLVVIFLLTALSATARKKEPVPVYIDKPPINRPRTMSIPDRNRLYKMMNPPIEISKETREYLEKLKEDEEWREENMSRNEEPTPANNRPL
jgi:hypothetical protein